MSNRTITLSDELYEYVLSVSLRESDLLRELREETMSHPMARMQISPEQGQFIQLLVRLTGATRALEIGVFTGYSSLCVATALPDEGSLIACDVSEEWTNIAKRYWLAAEVDGKIDLRLAPAVETLDVLLGAGQAESFDFCFIDADKVNYANYFERALKLLKPGGLIAVDNTLWGGDVINNDDQSEDTKAIRAFNRQLHLDERVSISLVPIGDGLTLALKNR